ncbi:MAG: hypothetical protein ACK41V_23825, partial [Acidovorax sp.]|uniref:hypothetical protein n=1 Tax=Acidovorax sp. TaxID=1872122 RepID=UPI00391BED14
AAERVRARLDAQRQGVTTVRGMFDFADALLAVAPSTRTIADTAITSLRSATVRATPRRAGPRCQCSTCLDARRQFALSVLAHAALQGAVQATMAHNQYADSGYRAYEVGCADQPDCPRDAAARPALHAVTLAAMLLGGSLLLATLRL